MKFAQGRTLPSQQKAQTLNSSTASAVLQQSARQQQQASQLKAMLSGSQQLTQRTLPDGAVSQQMALEDEETVQGKFEATQLMELEEEPLQGKFEPVQRMALEEDEPMQGKFESAAVSQRQAEAGAVNNTGMPDQLKAGIENLSGYAMDDVKVHYNSAKPAQMQAHAYAQGTDIHIAPGQEQHLPHEAWHVVQQKQGRVQATTQLKGEAINDDPGLEHEADVMGAKALQRKADSPLVNIASHNLQSVPEKVAQRAVPTSNGQNPHPEPDSGSYKATPSAKHTRYNSKDYPRSKFSFGKYTRNEVLAKYPHSKIGNRIVSVQDQGSGQMVNVEGIHLDHKVSWDIMSGIMNQDNNYSLYEARMYYNDQSNLHPTLGGLNSGAGSSSIQALEQKYPEVNAKIAGIQTSWMNLQNYITAKWQETGGTDVEGLMSYLTSIEDKLDEGLEY